MERDIAATLNLRNKNDALDARGYMDGHGVKPHARKAQGATEYIVLLGVVLVLALITVGVLNMFPDSSSEIRISISNSYWGSSNPFAIYQHAMTTDGVLTLTVFNRGPKALHLQGVLVDGDDNLSGQNLTPKDLPPGRQVSRVIALGHTFRPYETYALNVNLSYEDADSELPSQIQMGKEPIVGHCSGLSSGLTCGGLLCNGQSCTNPNQCQSHHCHDFGSGKMCVECIGNGHCDQGQQCVNGVCQ